MEVFVIVRLGLVPRAGVEPARPYGQRILSPLQSALPGLTKRYEPVFIGLAVVKYRFGWLDINALGLYL